MVPMHDGWSWIAKQPAHRVKSTAEILLILARTVSCGGNLFLNFGPTGYGTILPIIEERLTQIGKWLENNGDAIYGTKPWIYQNESATVWYTSKVKSDDGLESERIFNPQTEKNTIVYAIVTYQAWPKDGVLKLKQVKITDQTKMYLLGYGPVSFKPEGGSIEILLNTIPWKELPSLDAWAIKMEYLQDDGHVPEAMVNGGVYSAHGLPPWFLLDLVSKNPYAVDYVKRNFPPNFTHTDFGPQFKAEYFNATQFAKIVQLSGAKNFILTAKHMDGYTMYPSKYSGNWNSVDLGPKRDLIGTVVRGYVLWTVGLLWTLVFENVLARARPFLAGFSSGFLFYQGIIYIGGEVRSALEKFGMEHFGVVFSHIDLTNRLFRQDRHSHYKTNEFVTMINQPQLREMVAMYKPDIIYTIWDWGSPEYWNSTQFLAWLYNSSPVKDSIVVNDQWGTGTKGKHGGFFTDSAPPGLRKHKWVSGARLSASWSWIATAGAGSVRRTQSTLFWLARTVSCGGNLFLNFGPTGYGTIPPVIEERLTQIGKWLETNGEAIYGTKPWIYQNDTAENIVWYTSKVRSDHGLEPDRIFNPQTEKNTIVYAIVTQLPEDGTVKLKNVKTTKQTKMSLLGYDGPVTFKPQGGLVEIFLNTIPWRKLPSLDAWVIKMEYLQDDGHVPLIIETDEEKFENYDEF